MQPTIQPAAPPVQKPNRIGVCDGLALVYVLVLPFNGLALGARSLPFAVGAGYLIARVIAVISGRSGFGGATVPMVLPAGIYAVFCALSYYWSIWPEGTIVHVLTLSLMVVTSWALSVSFASRPQVIPVAFLAGSCALAVFVVLSPTSWDDRRTAFGNANDVALSLAVGLACAVYLITFRPGAARWFGSLSLPFVLTGMISTGSRTAVIAAAAIAVPLIFMLCRQRAWSRVLGVTVVGVVTITTLAYLPARFLPERILGIDSALGGSTLSNRTVLWDAILARGQDLFGLGAGGLPFYLRSYGTGAVAHNVVLGVLAETGWIGLLLFIFVLVRAMLDGRHSACRTLLPLIALPVAVASFTLTLETDRLFWFVIALAWAIPRRPVLSGGAT